MRPRTLDVSLGRPTNLFPTHFESGHMIGRAGRAVFVPTKEVLMYREAVRGTSFHVAAVPTHGRLLDRGPLGQGNPVPKDEGSRHQTAVERGPIFRDLAIPGLFIRPLLNCSKLELQVFLKNNNLTWMEDSSNQSNAYLRNRVRLELVPLLEELSRQGLQSRISDMSGQSKLLRECLDSQYEKWRLHCQNNKSESPEVLSLTDLEKANDLLQQEIMHNFINSQTELKLSYAKLQNIFELIHTDNNNWQFSLSKKWSIFRSLNNLELHLNSES